MTHLIPRPKLKVSFSGVLWWDRRKQKEIKLMDGLGIQHLSYREQELPPLKLPWGLLPSACLFLEPVAVQLHLKLTKGLLLCPKNTPRYPKVKLIKPRTETVFEKAEWAPYHNSQGFESTLSNPKSPWEINYKACRQAWEPTEVAETGPRHIPQLSRTSRQLLPTAAHKLTHSQAHPHSLLR